MKGISRPLLAVTIVLAACGADTTAESTSSTKATTASTTSTSVATTTSTTTSATTTSTISPTTTSTLLEGNWAEMPVIAAASWVGILGWWDGQTWVQPQAEGLPPVSDGEDFWTVTVESVGRATTTGTQVVCEWFDPPNVMVGFPDSSALEVWVGDNLLEGVAISAPWHPVPHDVGAITDDGTHADFASDVLRDLGLEVDTPQIKQVLRADLEGDGVLEKIVVAEDTDLQLEEISDAYSVVFVRRLAGETVVTDVLASSVVPPNETGFGSAYGVGAVADLNGDGVMEVVVSGTAWESGWLEVFELDDDRFNSVLSAGCGV